MYAGQPAGRYPYAGLGGFFDDVARIAGKVGTVASQAQEVAGQAASVAAGKQKVALIPTSGSYATVPVPGQPFGVTFPLAPLLWGGAVLVAFSLLKRR